MRFATAHDVLLAYPQMALGFQTVLDDTPSQEFLERLLADGESGDAIAFAAHLLARREAVWWAAHCVRMEHSGFDKQEENAIAAAESWVKEPGEAKRKELLAMSDKMDPMLAAGWVARAAAWSGGALIDTGTDKMMTQPHMTHAAARAAVLMAFGASPDPHRFARAAIDEALVLLTRNADR